MPDEIPSSTSERIIAELIATRQALESVKQTMEDRFEAALRPIERAIRAISLIPLALIFGGLSSWLFYVGKITENTWFWMSIFLLTPIFGEAARVVLDKIPMAKPAQAILSKTSLWLFGAICLLQALTGCAGPEKAGAAVSKAWDFYNENYERSLAISTTTDGKPMATFTITQRQPVKPVATAAPSDFTQDQVAELMAHFAKYAIKDGKAVIPAGK